MKYLTFPLGMLVEVPLLLVVLSVTGSAQENLPASARQSDDDNLVAARPEIRTFTRVDEIDTNKDGIASGTERQVWFEK